MPGEADIILLGYGVDDALQLTVQAQRVLTQTGKVYTVSLPPGLGRFLKSQRVQIEDLTSKFQPGRAFSDCYLDVADLLLQRTAVERPVCFLSPGNPMFLNSLNRFIYMQAQRRGLTIQAIPAVSLVDSVVNELGIDVGTFGLQIFDARRLVSRRQRVNPSVPMILVQVAGFNAEVVGERPPSAYEALASYLAEFYPPDHLVTLLSREITEGPSRLSRPLARFTELVPSVRTSSALFFDAVRAKRPRAEQTSN